MNRRTFIRVISGAIVLLLAGKVSILSAERKGVKVVESASGYKVIFPDGKILHTNETGLIVLDGIKAGKAPETIARELSALTGESYDKVIHDVRNFVHNLKVVGIV